MKKTDFLGNELIFECLSCSIANKKTEIPGGLIFESKNFAVYQDPFVPLPGFLVFSSKRHIKAINEMSVKEYNEFFALVEKGRKIIKKYIPMEKITVVQEDKAEHFNIWFFPWTKEIVTNYGEPDKRKLAYILNDLRSEKITPAKWKELSETVEIIKKEINSKL